MSIITFDDEFFLRKLLILGFWGRLNAELFSYIISESFYIISFL